MNGSKLLVIGVLVGFGGGMAAAIGMKLAKISGSGDGTPVESATPTAVAVGSVAPVGSSNPATPENTVKAAPTITPFDMRPTATARVVTENDDPATPKPTPTKKVAMITKGSPTPDDAMNDLPVEGPPASLVFGKGAGGNAIIKIIEERHNDTSLVRVELSGKARYKILQLPKRHELWIDFEDTEIPGGERTAVGSNVHVEEVKARRFEEGPSGPVARVTVRLANDGKFAVFPSKGTGEADGMLEIMLGP